MARRKKNQTRSAPSREAQKPMRRRSPSPDEFHGEIYESLRHSLLVEHIKRPTTEGAPIALKRLQRPPDRENGRTHISPCLLSEERRLRRARAKLQESYHAGPLLFSPRQIEDLLTSNAHWVNPAAQSATAADFEFVVQIEKEKNETLARAHLEQDPQRLTSYLIAEPAQLIDTAEEHPSRPPRFIPSGPHRQPLLERPITSWPFFQELRQRRAAASFEFQNRTAVMTHHHQYNGLTVIPPAVAQIAPEVSSMMFPSGFRPDTQNPSDGRGLQPTTLTFQYLFEQRSQQAFTEQGSTPAGR